MNPFEEEIERRGSNPFEAELVRRSGSKDYVPIPGPIIPELAPEFEPLINRNTYVGTGATLGGLAGAPAGPVGMAGGGVLGATAGSYTHDLAQNIKSMIRGREVPYQDLGESTRLAGREAYNEALWGPGTMAAGPILQRIGKPLLGKVLGTLDPEAKRLTDLAHGMQRQTPEGLQAGVDLGAAHVSKRKLAKGLPRVLGVFPFVGTPYRQGQARVVGQLDEAAADMLNTLAPATTKYDVAKSLTKAAVKRHEKFNTVSAALYKRFYGVADNLPVKDIVPTVSLKEEMADVVQREGIEKITLTTGEQFRKFGTDPIGDWLKQVSDFPDLITVEQARGLERELNAILRTAGREGWDVSRLSGMKGALQTAKNSLDVSRLDPDDAARVLGAWNSANEFFGQSKAGFQTPTAKRFGRVDKNIFGKGVFKPGTINEDQIFEAVYQSKSPEALSDLRNLVGPGEFKKATRKFLDTTLKAARTPHKEGAIVEDMFSAADFEKRLGLDTQEGWDALGEMLKSSHVTTKDFRQFLEVAKTATDITIRDPSTFVMRRLVLGAGLAGSVAMGAGHISLPAAAVITGISRGGAKFMMNPKQLRLMTRILDSSTSDHARRMLITRAIRLSEEPKENKPRSLPR